MKYLAIVWIAALPLYGAGFPVTEEKKAEIIKGLEGWEQIAAAQGDISDADYLKKLGVGLRKTSQSVPYFLGDRVEVHMKIRDKMLGIPGHAEHFGNRITASYDKFKGGYEEGKGGFYRYLFDTESREAFATLAFLPSPETVKVLGEMLDEDWKWPGYEEGERENGYQSTLDTRALSALSKLPIANPPSKPMLHILALRENIGVWRQWYSEIESGQRTFRFIGDPVEYDLRGPSKRGAVTPGLRNTKRNAKAGADAPSPDKPRAERSGYLPYLIGGLFMLAGCFLYLKGRKRAT